mgnify:FL=1
MKKLFVITALLGVTFAATAQNDSKKPFRVSIGAEAGLPMGDYGDYYSAVFGGSLQSEYSLDDNLAATLNAGYLNFSGKNGSGSDGFVPVMAGIKYNFTEKVFAAGQLGLMFSTASGGGSAFTYSPGVGYQISSNISALVKYTGWSKNSVNGSMVGLRLAYSF